jgi:hypothetical protein
MDGLAGYFDQLARRDARAGGTLAPPAAVLGLLDRALDSVRRLPRSTARANVLQGLVGVYRGLSPGRVPASAMP